MLPMAEHAVEVAAVVARHVVGEATARVFLGQLPMLALLLGLIVLLPVLDEAALAVQRRSAVVSLETFRDRLPRRCLVELLDESRVGLLAMLPFGMHLPARCSLTSLAHDVTVSTVSDCGLARWFNALPLQTPFLNDYRGWWRGGGWE
jgi:hypothetical protein